MYFDLHLSVCLFVSQSVCQSVSLSVCLSVYLFIYQIYCPHVHSPSVYFLSILLFICSLDPFILPQLQVDKGAIKFILSGANIMCPGLTSAGARMDVDLPEEMIVVS